MAYVCGKPPKPYKSENGFCRKHQPKFDADGKKIDNGCSCCPGAGCFCKFIVMPIVEALCVTVNPAYACFTALETVITVIDCFNPCSLSGPCGPKSCLGCINCINPRFACAGRFAGSRYQREKAGWASSMNPCADCCAGTPSVECEEPGCKRHVLEKKSKDTYCGPLSWFVGICCFPCICFCPVDKRSVPAVVAELGESKEACKSIVCAVKDGVRVRKPGPIPSDSFAKGVVKYNATITVLPDPVSSEKGEQYFALADGSGYVPVNTKKGNAAFTLTPSPDALGESKEACKSIVCAVKDGVRVRKPGPIPSDSFAKGVVKYNATITVLPDPVSSKKGEQYFALADGSGYVPVNTKKGNPAWL